MAKKKKNKFAQTFRSLTDIGAEFNLSSVKVGRELKRLGYRDKEGTPTRILEDEDYKRDPSKKGQPAVSF